MPDLKTRFQHEDALATMILALWQDQQARVGRSGMAVDWPSFARDTRAIVQDQLRIVFVEAAEQLANEFGEPYNPEQLAVDAQRWAAERAMGVANGITQTTADHVYAAIGRAKQEHETELALAALLALIFSANRASMIGITETTTAITAGERHVVTRINQAGGAGVSEPPASAPRGLSYGGRLGRGERKLPTLGPPGAFGLGDALAADEGPLPSRVRQLVPLWQTAEDERVCEVCEPLNGTGEEVWGVVSPSGPPAHPRCRCHLKYEPTLVGALA